MLTRGFDFDTWLNQVLDYYREIFAGAAGSY